MENQGNMKMRIAQVGKVIDIQTQAEKGTSLLLHGRKPQNPQQTPFSKVPTPSGPGNETSLGWVRPSSILVVKDRPLPLPSALQM